jgi:hypothetical protein
LCYGFGHEANVVICNYYEPETHDVMVLPRCFFYNRVVLS